MDNEQKEYLQEWDLLTLRDELLLREGRNAYSHPEFIKIHLEILKRMSGSLPK